MGISWGWNQTSKPFEATVLSYINGSYAVLFLYWWLLASSYTTVSYWSVMQKASDYSWTVKKTSWWSGQSALLLHCAKDSQTCLLTWILTTYWTGLESSFNSLLFELARNLAIVSGFLDYDTTKQIQLPSCPWCDVFSLRAFIRGSLAKTLFAFGQIMLVYRSS